MSTDHCLPHEINCRPLGTTYLAEGRSSDPPMLFPFVELRRRDVSPEKREDLVSPDGLDEFLTGTEDRLLNSELGVSIPISLN